MMTLMTIKGGGGIGRKEERREGRKVDRQMDGASEEEGRRGLN